MVEPDRCSWSTTHRNCIRCDAAFAQFTILGPLLSIVFIDDLLQQIADLYHRDVTVICNADDVTLLCHGHHPERLATLSRDVDMPCQIKVVTFDFGDAIMPFSRHHDHTADI